MKDYLQPIATTLVAIAIAALALIEAGVIPSTRVVGVEHPFGGDAHQADH